jgi:aerobic-type carbon monoxide dehydrogenase small subunit (CoxS/CutS family)
MLDKVIGRAVYGHDLIQPRCKVRAGLAGNLCRFTGYTGVVEVVLAACACHIPDG